MNYCEERQAWIAALTCGGSEKRYNELLEMSTGYSPTVCPKCLKPYWTLYPQTTNGVVCECIHPVQALVDLLGGLPVDDDTWRAVVDEPYG